MTDLQGNPTVGGIVLNARDITERRALEDDLVHAAYHDSLTGLPNRAFFAERVEQEVQSSEGRATGIAILFVDLDDFKTVNDGLGHSVGDQVLVATAERLSGCLRASDIAAASAVTSSPFCYKSVSERRTHWRSPTRILAEISEPLSIGDRELTTTASIGIVLTEDGSATAAQLLA